METARLEFLPWFGDAGGGGVRLVMCPPLDTMPRLGGAHP